MANRSASSRTPDLSTALNNSIEAPVVGILAAAFLDGDVFCGIGQATKTLLRLNATRVAAAGTKWITVQVASTRTRIWNSSSAESPACSANRAVSSLPY